MADEKMIITIGREHGTMGDKVAEKIRRQFELPLYDKAHLLRIVEETDDYDKIDIVSAEGRSVRKNPETAM